MMVKNFRLGLGILICLFAIGAFFSYKILESPLGLTADEGSFGLNAALLSKTYRDENERFMPIFVLSLNGKDWRQPITQYYMAAFFKVFGASPFTLRVSSVVITVVSTALIFILAKELLGSAFGILATAVFVTTPLIMIQSHLGLDNIMPIPFVIGWLLLLYKYHQAGKLPYLFWSGVMLGISFYTYKGMRATIPVWVVLTIGYLCVEFFQSPSRQTLKQCFQKVLSFGLGVLPFAVAAPILERKYPGAVYDGKKLEWDSWYSFLYPYISSFDFGFLYVTGDNTVWHSTGKHGMMLLASLPLFLFGVHEALHKKKFWLFLLLAFFTTPLLYGFVGSIHRASRLMSLIPLYALICGLGALWLWRKNKFLLTLLVAISIFNYADFVNFYWNKYPELTRQWFGDLSAYKDYELLSKKAKELGLQPYVETQVAHQTADNGEFFEAAYLLNEVIYMGDADILPPGGILLSTRNAIPGLVKLELPTVKYKLHQNP